MLKVEQLQYIRVVLNIILSPPNIMQASQPSPLEAFKKHLCFGIAFMTDSALTAPHDLYANFSLEDTDGSWYAHFGNFKSSSPLHDSTLAHEQRCPQQKRTILRALY